jgi:hypothetical protein
MTESNNSLHMELTLLKYATKDFYPDSKDKIPQNQQNTWCIILLEKLTNKQLVKIFPTFYGT